MRTGRPPKPIGERHSERLQVPLKPAQLRAITAAAKRQGRPAAEIAREATLRAISDMKKPADPSLGR